MKGNNCSFHTTLKVNTTVHYRLTIDYGRSIGDNNIMSLAFCYRLLKIHLIHTLKYIIFYFYRTRSRHES